MLEESKVVMAEIVVRQRDGKVVLANLRRHLTAYEKCYEMRSAEMAKRLSLSEERETAEISKWMQTYQVVKRLVDKQTPSP